MDINQQDIEKRDSVTRIWMPSSNPLYAQHFLSLSYRRTNLLICGSQSELISVEYFVYIGGETSSHIVLCSCNFFFGQQVLFHFKAKLNVEIKNNQEIHANTK